VPTGSIEIDAKLLARLRYEPEFRRQIKVLDFIVSDESVAGRDGMLMFVWVEHEDMPEGCHRDLIVEGQRLREPADV